MPSSTTGLTGRAVARSEIPSSQTGVKGTVVPLRGAGCPRLSPLFAPPQAAKKTLQQSWLDRCKALKHLTFILSTDMIQT